MLDLDARRAQYDDVAKPVKLGGVVYDLPARMPLLVAVALNDGDFGRAIGILFGAEHVDTVAALLDRDLFVELAREVYGSDAGESSASSDSSPTTGGRSRRTSKGSTGSTSRKRASASTPQDAPG